MNFEKDLEKLKNRLQNEQFACKLYSALCNMRWKNKSNPSEVYSCSWRYAGGLVADLRDKGEDYLDFYCSGNEGVVDEEIRELLDELGWEPFPWDSN